MEQKIKVDNALLMGVLGDVAHEEQNNRLVIIKTRSIAVVHAAQPPPDVLIYLEVNGVHRPIAEHGHATLMDRAEVGAAIIRLRFPEDSCGSCPALPATDRVQPD